MVFSFSAQIYENDLLNSFFFPPLPIFQDFTQNIFQGALPNQPLYQSLPSLELLLHLFPSFDSF